MEPASLLTYQVILLLFVFFVLIYLFITNYLSNFSILETWYMIWYFSGNGYCRSEAAVAVLLTKKSMAKRVYATMLNAGNNTDGYKEQGSIQSAILFVFEAAKH